MFFQFFESIARCLFLQTNRTILIAFPQIDQFFQLYLLDTQAHMTIAGLW